MKKYLDSIVFLLVFISVQFGAVTLVTVAWHHFTGSPDVTAPMLITAMTLFNVVAIAVFLLAGWAQVSPRWLRTRPWGVLCWSCIAAVGAIVPSMWLQEQMPDLPNVLEEQFTMLLGSRWGYLAIGLLAPLCEELVFRGAILRSLLSPECALTSRRPWVAIGVSALLFALIHGNPAQMPHAFLVGLLLGWMYWRTGSILPGVAYHWVNNSVAYVLYNLYPDPSLRLADIFGSQQRVAMAVGCSLLVLLPALFQLALRMRRADE